MRLPVSESDIQVELYYHCRRFGLNCRTEVVTPRGRLDLVILSADSERLLLIVECKNGLRYNFHRSRQVRRYSELGVPILSLFKLSEAKSVAQDILKKVRSLPGVTIEQVMSLPRNPRRERRARGEGRKVYLFMDEDLNVKPLS